MHKSITVALLLIFGAWLGSACTSPISTQFLSTAQSVVKTQASTADIKTSTATLIPTLTSTPTPTSTAMPTATSQPAGIWIAYVAEDENIWLADLEGNRLQLTVDGVPGNGIWAPIIGYRDLKWSPDGSLLGALRIDKNGTQIIAIRISDMYVLHLLSDTEGSYDWLPDGRTIVFSNLPYASQRVSPGGLSLLDISTGEVSTLIQANPNLGLVGPDWAGEGDFFYFSIQPAPVPDAIWGDALGLASTRDGKYLEIQNTAQRCDWSPDGEMLACGSGSGEILCNNLVIFSNTGERVSELIAGGGCSNRIVKTKWSPDGNWIAFSGEAAGNNGIFIIRPDGSDLTYLGPESLGIVNPAWSPDSQTLAFLSIQDESPDIVMINIQSRQVRNLTNSPGEERGLAWQPGYNPVETQPTPMATVGSLNLADLESIVYWLANDMAHGKLDAFAKVVMPDSLLYGTGMSNGRDAMDRQTFLSMLEDRISSKPTCAGYFINEENTAIMLWTKGWQPLWDFQGIPTSDEITFRFFVNNGKIETWAFFTPSSNILEEPSVIHSECPKFGE